MTNLREKYAETIENMRKDAEANVTEAAEIFDQRTKDREEAQEKLDAINSIANHAQEQFKEKGKRLKQLGRANKPSPVAVDSIADMLHVYSDAARKVPEAEMKLKEADEMVKQALNHRLDAEAELSKISFFANEL